MKDFSMKEMQDIALDILIYYKKVCDENSLKYYLAYGTLLGAIRHGGYIPWDDDIDVMMPRRDYDALVKYLADNPHEYYQLVSYDNNKDFTAPLPKIIDKRTTLIQQYGFVEKVQLGVYIDIFVLDGVGEMYEESRVQYNRGRKLLENWMRAATILFPPHSCNRIRDILRFVRNIPNKVLGIGRCIEKIYALGSSRDFYSNRYVATFSLPLNYSPEESIYEQVDFGDGIVKSFEGVDFTVPRNYEGLLKKWYGEYMKLPPEDNRITHHNYVAYWRDDI